MVVLSAPVVQALADANIPQNAANPAEHEYLVEVAMAVRSFSLGNDSAPMPAGEDHRVAITPDAIHHLLDVRVVFVLSELAFLLLFVLLLILIIVRVRRKGSGSLTRPLIIGGALPLAAALLLGLAIAIDFNAFFIWMHGIFFASGSWTFPADSLLIRALPYEFWVSSAVVWAVSMAVFCIASISIGIVLKRRSQRLGHGAHGDGSRELP